MASRFADSKSVSEQEYQELCAQAHWHNYLYFVKNQPQIDDATFDALIEQIRRIEQIHPDWIRSDSPVTKLAETTTEGFAQLAHRSPMLSLEKAFCFEQIRRFEKRIRQEVADPLFCVEYKIDGCALAIWYQNGHLVKALTRGDGLEGDDVSENIRAAQLLPTRLQGPVPSFVELRGEVYMPFAALNSLNERRRLEGQPTLANTRNAAAGSLKLLDARQAATRGLKLAVYQAQDEPLQQLADLRSSWGFIEQQQLPSTGYYRLVRTSEQIIECIHQVDRERPHLPFAIDGVVVKLCDVRQAQRLGATGQYYRWGLAYKFSPQEASTQLLQINLQVGKTGVVTPVASLQPVLLDGSLVSRCTLHNSEEIARKDIRVGDWVVIAKGGDVIPKVLSVDLSRRAAGSAPWRMPQECPACHSPLVRAEQEVAWHCPNSAGCRAQSLRRLAYFVSKAAFDIEGLGQRTLEQLFDAGVVHSPAELFKLSVDDLLQLDGFASVSARKLYEAIQKRKQIALDRFLASLNIKHLGVTMAEQLARCFASLPGIMQASVESLDQLDGVGRKAAEAIRAGFEPGGAAHSLVQELLAVGVEPYWKQQATLTGHPFSGKSFVLTGSLLQLTRAQGAKLIKERGGAVVAGVSAKTDYLVVGQDPGSKLERAQQLGVQTLSEEQFKKLL